VDKKKILKIVLISASLPLAFVIIVFIRASAALESKNELLNFKNATASVVLSQEGELLGKFFTENRTNISYESIPSHFVDALIATEDIRFFKHNGIDARSLWRVFIKTILLRRGTGGGSTITQQLAKNLFGRDIKGPFRIFVIKTKEALLARRIEKVYSKTEILTLYLNTVPFGENVYGIQAASQRYYNKKLENLTIEESAVLVGMLKANSIYNPRLNPENALKRRNVVLSQMEKYKFLTTSDFDSISRLPLLLNYTNIEMAGPADYFLYQVKREAKIILQGIDSVAGQKWNIEEDGLIITTTLNIDLQRFANDAFHEHLSVMQKRLDQQYNTRAGKRFINTLVQNELKVANLKDREDEVSIRHIFDWEGSFSDSISIIDSLRHNIKLLHAGLLAIDPVTGSVKAWVGGIDFKTQPYDQILARRQMGSTFKPIVFAAAFNEGIEPCHYLDNDSVVLPGYDDWSPQNFDHTYGGKYSLTGALVHSMNVPTFNLFLKVGFNAINSLWHKMGFTFKLDNTPSLPLGTAEANIEELAVAYSAFANNGFKIVSHKILSIKSPDGRILWQNELLQPGTRVLSDSTCQMMNEILQKAVRQGTGYSLRSVYNVQYAIAGKTGTSQDYTDSWFAAYNPALVIICRVGASLPSIHFNNQAYGTGGALALPLVGLTLNRIQGNPGLARQFIAPFPLSVDLNNLMDCDDFRENNTLDDLKDFFGRDRIEYDSTRRNENQRSFFRKLFRRRERPN
jgi:penicillin-binding protein 1A